LKYMKQFTIILIVTCIGEFLNHFIDLPIPASIYGLVLMLILLVTKVIKLESVDKTAEFLIEIMPVMFIPAGVGLITAWGDLKPVVIPIVIISIVSTFLVMAVTGKVADFVIGRDAESNAESWANEESSGDTEVNADVNVESTANDGLNADTEANADAGLSANAETSADTEDEKV